MSATTTTDANGKLATASAGGGGDLSAAVVLDPATSVRNVIAPTTAVKALIAKGDVGNTQVPFEVQRGSDAFRLAAFGNVAGSNNYDSYIYTLILGAGVIYGGSISNTSDVNISAGRVLIKAGGAANARLVVTGDAAQTGRLTQWNNSAPTEVASVSAAGQMRGSSLVTDDYILMNGAGAIRLDSTATRLIQYVAGDTQFSGVNVFVTDAGKGIKLKSPDGLTTKTVTIDNAGALALI